ADALGRQETRQFKFGLGAIGLHNEPCKTVPCTGAG
ncbi:MAG: hypothetical protein RL484_505, partial [Actinomycetota bacterium]